MGDVDAACYQVASCRHLGIDDSEIKGTCTLGGV
jgi:hypothetical protein